VNKFLIIFLLLPLISFGQKEMITLNQFSLDNERQFNFRSYKGYLTQLDSLFKKDSIFIKRKTIVGISTGLRYYKTDIDKIDYLYNESKIIINTKPIKNTNFIFKPSLVFGNGFSDFFYESQLTYQKNKFYVELSAEKDLVGARSVTQNLTTRNYGVSVDYSILKNLVIIGGGQYNLISNNSRWFYQSKLIYTLPKTNLYFDLRTRNMIGGEWSPLFFSPEAISQKQVGVGYSQSYSNENGVIKLYLGGGLQTIDDVSQYLFSVDVKSINRLSRKFKLESQIGVRNFNQYIFSFGEFNLRYFIF
jgi:hypothetical protein